MREVEKEEGRKGEGRMKRRKRRLQKECMGTKGRNRNGKNERAGKKKGTGEEIGRVKNMTTPTSCSLSCSLQVFPPLVLRTRVYHDHQRGAFDFFFPIQHHIFISVRPETFYLKVTCVCPQ